MREDPDLISVDEVEGQSPPTDGNQLKVLVHNVDVDEMPAAEYTAAVSRLIAVSNIEVKDSARTIAQHRRKMEGEMNKMWDIIQSADRSANPAVKERIKGLEEGHAKVEAAGELLQEAIEETIKIVNARLVDQEQIDMETTLMKMLTQTIQHSRNAKQEQMQCQERLEKFEKDNSVPTTTTQPTRGSSSSTWSSLWKADQSLKPTQLNKDAIPCDFRSFQRDFTTYIRSGETATVKATNLQVLGQMRICIDSELNSLMRDMWVEQGPNILEENLKNLEVVFMKRYPISKRRQMLLEAEQEAGEVTSVYWRRIRRMRYEAEIDQMTPDNWDTMLALAKTKDEAIKEKLIVIPDLTFDAAMATIETIEKARVSQGMEPTTVRKVKVQVNRIAQAKPASTIICFRCGVNGHYKSQCEMAPQKCPKCSRDHVLAAHKDFPPKKNTGDTVRKTPAKTGLKAKKKKPASKRINLSGESSESERESRTKRSKSKMRWEKLRRMMQSSESSESEEETSAESSRRVRVEVLPDSSTSSSESDSFASSSESDEEESAERARWVTVEVKGANMVENPTLSVDLWRRLTSKHHKSVIALADTGASKSVIGLALVKKYKLKLDTKKTRVSLTNASGHKMSVQGSVTIFLQPEGAPTRKMIKAIVSESVGHDFLIGLPDLKHLQLLPEDFPRYRGDKYSISKSGLASADLKEARITTDAGNNIAAGTIHWGNGASQKIFWDRGEGEKVRVAATEEDESDMVDTELEESAETEPEQTVSDHNGQDLPDGLEDVEGVGDPEEEPEFPGDLDSEVLAMCKRYKTVFSEHLKRGRHIKGAPMRINLVPEEKRVKPLYHAVPRVVPLHWREEADKIVRNLLKHDVIEKSGLSHAVVFTCVFRGQTWQQQRTEIGNGLPDSQQEHFPRSPLLPVRQRRQEENQPRHQVLHKIRSHVFISSSKNRQGRQRPHHFCHW